MTCFALQMADFAIGGAYTSTDTRATDGTKQIGKGVTQWAPSSDECAGEKNALTQISLFVASALVSLNVVA